MDPFSEWHPHPKDKSNAALAEITALGCPRNYASVRAASEIYLSDSYQFVHGKCRSASVVAESKPRAKETDSDEDDGQELLSYMNTKQRAKAEFAWKQVAEQKRLSAAAAVGGGGAFGVAVVQC